MVLREVKKMTNRRKNGENSMFSPFFLWFVHLNIHSKSDFEVSSERHIGRSLQENNFFCALYINLPFCLVGLSYAVEFLKDLGGDTRAVFFHTSRSRTAEDVGPYKVGAIFIIDYRRKSRCLTEDFRSATNMFAQIIFREWRSRQACGGFPANSNLSYLPNKKNDVV